MRHAQKLGEMLPEEPVDISPLLQRKTSDLPDEVGGGPGQGTGRMTGHWTQGQCMEGPSIE